MLSFVAQVLLIVSGALAVPVENAGNSATVGKIRGVRDPIYHLYLQANSKNGMPPLIYQPSYLYFSSSLPLTHIASIPVLGPETAADEFTIGGTIQSKKTSLYLNIATTSTSYKPLVWMQVTTTCTFRPEATFRVEGRAAITRQYIYRVSAEDCYCWATCCCSSCS